LPVAKSDEIIMTIQGKEITEPLLSPGASVESIETLQSPAVDSIEIVKTIPGKEIIQPLLLPIPNIVYYYLLLLGRLS
jgi:hypothetical protein